MPLWLLVAVNTNKAIQITTNGGTSGAASSITTMDGPPSVTSLTYTGCSNSAVTNLTDCPHVAGGILTIDGTKFGSGQTPMSDLAGLCSAVTWVSSTRVTCTVVTRTSPFLSYLDKPLMLL